MNVSTSIGKEAREALRAYKMGVFNTDIAQRVSYAESIIFGLSVIQYKPV
jgi:hypothetical protein